MSHEYLAPSDDLPKLNPWQEDRLGYAPFAKRLSNSLLRLQAPDGYVIGLHGEWGSGKTTALNFVKQYLQKHNLETENAKTIELIDFAPWIVSGHQDLIAAYFKVLAEKMGKRPSAAKRWLRHAKGSVGALVKAAAKMGVLINPAVGLAAGAASTALGASFDTMLKNFLEEPSLQAAYEELRDELKANGKKYLVVIDDIDRLQREEIRYVMQMVKTVGRLPNVIYLLAYDREIVWAALDDSSVENRTGPNFAEKIVQHELELPKPLIDDLLSMLDQETGFVVGPIPSSARWHTIVNNGIRRWIRQPRDVFRLANALKFSWPALQGEIDPQDLFAMEGIRLFDGETFTWLRWNRDFLFSEGNFIMAEESLRKAAVERLMKSVPEKSRLSASQLLSVLFPQRHKVFSGRAMFGEPYYEMKRRRGVGTQEGYDAYFSLFPSPDAVPKSIVDGAMNKLNDETALKNLFTEYVSKENRRKEPMIPKLFQEIAFRFEPPTLASPTPELLKALVTFGDQILRMEGSGNIFQLSPRDAYRLLIKRILEALGPEKAASELESIVEHEDGVFISSMLVLERARELGELPRAGRDNPVISTDAARRLASKLRSKIERAAADGTLVRLPFFYHVLQCWKYAGGTEPAKQWISTTARSDAQAVAKIASSHLSYTLGGDRNYSMNETPDSALYDYKALNEACALAIKSGKLDSEELKQVETFRSGLSRLVSEQNPPEPLSEAPSG